MEVSLGQEFEKTFEPIVVSTGLFDLQVAVAQEDKLQSMKPNFVKMTELSKELDMVGVHAFLLSDHSEWGSEHYPVKVRNFAPRFGIDEESATGTSNCALACLLKNKNLVSVDKIYFEQG